MTRSEIFTWAFPIMTMWCLFIIAHTAAAIMCRSWIITEPFPTHSSFTTRHRAGGKVGPRAPTSINFKTDFRTKNMHKVSFDFIELFILCVKWIVHVGKRYDVDLSMQDSFQNTELLFFVENRLLIVLIITAFMIVILTWQGWLYIDFRLTQKYFINMVTSILR